MERIFTYGTLQDPVIQEAVLGHTMLGQPDALAGFRMSTIGFGRETYPIIIPDAAGGDITGIVYEVTPEELVLLDHYETSVYRRIQVTLASGLESWVYCQ